MLGREDPRAGCRWEDRTHFGGEKVNEQLSPLRAQRQCLPRLSVCRAVLENPGAEHKDRCLSASHHITG